MLGWLKRDPVEKLKAEYARKLEQACEIQRNGDIVRYSAVMAEAESLLQQIDSLEKSRAAQ